MVLQDALCVRAMSHVREPSSSSCLTPWSMAGVRLWWSVERLDSWMVGRSIGRRCAGGLRSHHEARQVGRGDRCITVIGLMNQGADGAKVSADSVSYDWPLTMTSGTRLRETKSAVAFQAPDGTTYAVNGSATSLGDQRGYEELESIWRDTRPTDFVPTIIATPRTVSSNG